MIESGLGLCAACLPVHYGLMKSKGVQSLVRSVQSAISLRSTSPRGSGGPVSKVASQTSREIIATDAEGPARDGDRSLEMSPTPQEHEIIVTHSLKQAQSFTKGDNIC